MSVRYPHLLSPIRVGSLVLKSRMVSGNALPHFLQGPESYPADPVINHMATVARNGAAYVTFADWCKPDQRSSPNEDGKRFPMYNLDGDPSVENYMCQLADQVHYYNSHISIALMPFSAPDPCCDVSDAPAVDLTSADPFQPKFGQPAPEIDMAALWRNGAPAKQLTPEQIRDIIEEQAQRARRYQILGFDMVTLHFAYRATLFGRFLSPVTNTRTDEYGGSLENRARFLLELCRRIKQLCGQDFPIEVQITPEELEENGMTLEETCRLAKLAEGLVDIFQFRAATGSLNHPTGYNSDPTHYAVLEASAAVKATGTRILCAPIGGFQNVEDMEQALAQGKADLIAGARMFLADFDFYDKVRQGRGEDVVPCIRCNKCHVPSLSGEWLSYCSVNPRMGIEHRLEHLTRPAAARRRIAVVGGGPAGMRAALLASERGHQVTLYEKTDRLGGQLNLMDEPSFKWPLVRYRQWLISQIQKSPVEVHVSHTPDRVELEDCDVLLLALGAVPKAPPIPGAERAYNIFSVFGNESKMGHRCVVIGGSESGTEAGMYLAEYGHEVTILTRGEELAPEATPIHYREMMDDFYQHLNGISYRAHATATEIGEGYVRYLDENGEEQRIDCDDVVALGGMTPLSEEAMAYYGIVSETYMIGDCFQVGNLHTCNRMAYSAVCNL